MRFVALGGIVLSAMALGQLWALHLESRHRDLESIRVGLRALATEIEYARRPLPRAWRDLADTYGGACAEIFSAAAAAFGEEDAATAGAAWTAALRRCAPAVHLTAEDGRILASLGGVLGASAGSDQVGHLRAVDERLADQMEEARRRSRRRGKLSRSLGLLGGILIAVILA